MSVRSDTVSSASESSARTRSRVSSPAALRAALRSSNLRRENVDMRSDQTGWDLSQSGQRGAYPKRHKDIFIRRNSRWQAHWADLRLRWAEVGKPPAIWGSRIRRRQRLESYSTHKPARIWNQPMTEHWIGIREGEIAIEL